MEIIIHRINSIEILNTIDNKYGAEIDIRSIGSEIILNHDPFGPGEKLVDYLDEYRHGTLVFNVKEAGYEDEILRMVRERPYIKSYFLLDVEFPYIFKASQRGEKNMAIRFSEHESIETVKHYVNKVDWIWIDTFTNLPISNDNCNTLSKFNICLVCPERWGRPNDIEKYIQVINSVNISIDAVMTSKQFAGIWLNYCDQ